MMIATTLGGALMYAVHKIAGKMPKEEYGDFTTLLQIVTLMSIPAVGLQSVFAQQAAGVMTPAHERDLAGVFRGVLRGTFFIWLAMVAVAFLFRDQLLASLKIANSAALWMAITIALVGVWRPIVQGVLQGRQNFAWLGAVIIGDGVGRFAGVCLIVGLLGHFAAGAMISVMVGMLLAFGVGGWFCRDCLRGAAAPVNWGPWLRRVTPLTLGMGVGVFMLAADMIFVKLYFAEKQVGFYGAAGMIGRALVYFTTPVATVMFPKLARSKATGEKSNAFALALGVTALAGGGAAVACTLFPSLPIRIMYDQSYIDVSTPLVPWFAWCMLPLTLATVLLNSLMARAEFRALPWLVTVAAGYGLTLHLRLHSLGDYGTDKFPVVIQTLGIFGVILLAVCAWFSFRKHVAPR